MPCKAELTSPPPILRPPVPTRFTMGRIAAWASLTYCAACSTRGAETRRSGLLVIASATRALSWTSLKEASQLSAMGPAAAPAFQGSVRAKLVRVPDCWRTSVVVGGDLVAQPAMRIAHNNQSNVTNGARACHIFITHEPRT